MLGPSRIVGRAKPPARHFDVAQVLRGVPAVRRSAGNGASFWRFVSILVSAFCPPYDSAQAERALARISSHLEPRLSDGVVCLQIRRRALEHHAPVSHDIE